MDTAQNKNTLKIVIEESQNIDSESFLHEPILQRDTLCVRMEKIQEKPQINRKKKICNRTFKRASQGYKNPNPIDSAKVFQQFEATREKLKNNKKCFLLCC